MVGIGLPEEAVACLPEAMVGDCDSQKVLSTWEKLIWDQAKETLLSQALLMLPHIRLCRYVPSGLQQTKRFSKAHVASVGISSALWCPAPNPRRSARATGFFSIQSLRKCGRHRSFPHQSKGMRVSCRRCRWAYNCATTALTTMFIAKKAYSLLIFSHSQELQNV